MRDFCSLALKRRVNKCKKMRLMDGKLRVC